MRCTDQGSFVGRGLTVLRGPKTKARRGTIAGEAHGPGQGSPVFRHRAADEEALPVRPSKDNMAHLPNRVLGVGLQEGEGIREDGRCLLERHAVLAEVRERLLRTWQRERRLLPEPWPTAYPACGAEPPVHHVDVEAEGLEG